MDDALKLNGFPLKDSSLFLDKDRDFFFPETGGNEGFSVVWGNYNKCSREYKISRQDYPYFALEYIISGRGGFRCNDTEWELLPGMVFSFAPHVSHSYWSSCEDPLEKISVIFSCPQNLPIYSALMELTNRAYFVDAGQKIFEIFSFILEEGVGNSDSARQIINHLTQVLILRIERGENEGQSYNPSYASFLRCKQYIETCGSQKTPVSEIAKECNIDSSYMNRLFQKYMNCSSSNYLSRILIQKSMDLLKDSEMPIKDIASRLGFTNPYHFSAFFKKHVLVSPREFRKIRNSGECEET